jgi:hypothetical protein
MDDALKEILRDLVTLEVITRVGDAKVVEEQGNVFKFKRVEGNDERVFYTRIDLVDADIFTSLPHVQAGAEDEVRKLHQENVKLARDMIDLRVKALADIARTLDKSFEAVLKAMKNKPAPKPADPKSSE